MTVLVADTFESTGLDALRAAGCEVVYEPTLKDVALVDRVRSSGAAVLVVRGTKVTAAALETGALALVVRAGAGYNTIDVKAASRRGIYVSNCPGKNAIAVAELVMGLMVALDRRIPDNVADLRSGRWNKQAYSKARGLAGRTLGLLGYGFIGREVARRALAFDMRVLVWSRRFDRRPATVPDLPIVLESTPQAVAREADVLSVHLALTPETTRLVDSTVFSQMKPGSYFINTSRAEVVDTDALASAIAVHGIKAGLDVFDGEPSAATCDFQTPLAALAGVYGTHHIGASTEQAQDAIAAETVRIVLAFMQTGQVPNVVNLATITPATHCLVVRHRDRPGVLADVFDHLRRGGVNVQETQNVIFDGAEAAVARINLDARPSDMLIAAIRSGNDDIIDLDVVSL